jgi:tetratricopeptide (TPR) repeat protein
MTRAIALAVTFACGSRSQPPRSTAISHDTRALVDVARDHERSRRYDLARAAYERAIAQAPDAGSAAWASRQLATALLFWGDYPAAKRALERTVRLRPAEVSAWHDLGIVRAHQGDPAGAETAFRRSIALRPRAPMSRLALAALLVNQRRFPDALAEYDALLALELPERYRAAIERARRLIRAEQRRGR